MPLQDIIKHTITLGGATLGLRSLNIPIVAAILTTEQGTAWDNIYPGQLVASTGPQDFLTDLKALGVLTTEPLHVALVDMFSQRNPAGQQLAPLELLLGRRATPQAQVETITVDAFEGGNYTITITHTPGATVSEFIVPGNTDEDTTAGDIRSAITGIPITASGAGPNAVLTADEAGVPFLVAVTHSATPANISNINTTPNIGIGEDIAAWRLENDRWYFMLETTLSPGVVTTAAQAIEVISAPNKFGAFQTNDPLVLDGASTLDLISLLGPAGLNLTRSFIAWGPVVTDHIIFATIGKAAGLQPGAAGFEPQTLASVTGTVRTNSETASLEKKFAHWVEQYLDTDPPTSVSRGSQMLNGVFADLAWLIDDLVVRVQVRVLEKLRNSNTPYIGGEATVDGAIRGALLERADVLDVGSIEVKVPPASSQSAGNVVERRMDGVEWSVDALGKVRIVVIFGRVGVGGGQ